ncbi:MAG TPA: family 20 glycosylhydrolase [Holophaga sp.]|nr:family 20 glycosylhydrolase [Holophaga sp.]
MPSSARTTSMTALAALLLAAPGNSQTALQLRWDVQREGTQGRGAQAKFSLTNRDVRPLPDHGWAIYCNGMRQPEPGSIEGQVAFEALDGELARIKPLPGFKPLAPGATLEIRYRTGHRNVSEIPAGPYIVFDAEPHKGIPLDYATSSAMPLIGLAAPEMRYAQNALTRELQETDLPLVFPTPVRVQKTEGRLRFGPLEIIADPSLAAEAASAKALLHPWTNADPGAPKTLVRLHVGAVEGQNASEAYCLTVDPGTGIRIQGNSTAGVYYGIQSLRSLLGGIDKSSNTLPALKIIDAPRFGYRGMHIDVARNFQSKGSLFRVLDLMARVKLNALHLHLTDDEGWRIEIAGMPELTAVGAHRGHTLDSSDQLQPAYGSGPAAGQPFGSGFYTKADYIELLRYAAARHIEVIPELEMPGHARAAIKAMEARRQARLRVGDAAGAQQFLLSDPEDRSTYTSIQNFHDNVMNPAMPSTYAFIEAVVRELAAMHREARVPLRNLHMGGDEVPAGTWERSPIAQNEVKQRGMSSVQELWFLFYGRVEEILKAHGLGLSGWEEIGVRKTKLQGRDKIIPNPLFAERGWRTYVWNNMFGSGNEDLAYRLANGGYKVVLCPVSNFYFDLAYSNHPKEPGLSWGGYVDVDKPFAFIPFDYYRNAKEDAQGRALDRSIFVGKDRLTEYGRQNIVGIQGCLWSETLGGQGRLEYMLVPKLFGLAERAWAPDPAWAQEPDPQRAEALYQEAWSVFANVLGKRELPELDRTFPGLNYRIPTPGLKPEANGIRVNLQLPGFTLRYTTDGSEPSATSPMVAGLIPVPKPGIIRARAFNGLGRGGATATLNTASPTLE